MNTNISKRDAKRGTRRRLTEIYPKSVLYKYAETARDNKVFLWCS